MKAEDKKRLPLQGRDRAGAETFFSAYAAGNRKAEQTTIFVKAGNELLPRIITAIFLIFQARIFVKDSLTGIQYEVKNEQ